MPHLQALGVPRPLARAYAALSEIAPATAVQVARRMDEPDIDAVESGLEDLLVLGMVARDPDGFRLVPPAMAVTALELRQLAELAEATASVGSAYERYRRVAGEPDSAVLEHLAPPYAGQRLQHALTAARDHVDAFDSPPYADADAASVSDVECDLLARQVRYRTVYARAALEWPGRLDGRILPLIDAGIHAHVTPILPVKLWIVDSTTAFVGLTHHHTDRPATIVAITGSPLIAALTGLFEATWQHAAPLYPGTDPAAPVRLPPSDRRLLATLAAGLSDDLAARTLGISRRTFYRRLESLMARTGSTTRFQLALHTAHRNWL
ncbi:MAG: transcriptional regulator [Actinomycetia bacterium]|nr:transcriptional regulator [Actinomycetes bacterium]MDQ1652242.1 hypothetical protein [Cryptosporangiaceae bacterium]